jgi:hypothetical protein
MRAPAETAPDISKILLQRTTYPFNSSDFRYGNPQAGNRRPCGVSTARARQAVSPFLPVREPMVPRNALLFFVFSTSAARTAERRRAEKRHASLRLPSTIPLLMLVR